MSFSMEKWVETFGDDEISLMRGKMMQKYHDLPVVDVMHEVSQESIEIIRKLGIEVEDKIYTEYEFDVLDMKVSDYYIYEGMTEDEKKYIKSLDGTGVTQEDVTKVEHELFEVWKKHDF